MPEELIPMSDLDLSDALDKQKEEPSLPKEESEQAKEIKRGKDKIKALESSSVSGDLKELMNGWLEQNLSGESLNAYVDKVRENPKKITITSLLEGISETLLNQDKDLKKQFDDGEVTVMQLADNALDTVLIAGREAMPTEKYAEFVDGVQKATRLPSENNEEFVGSREGMEEFTPMLKVEDVVKAKIAELEESQYSTQLRELMNGWLEQHLSGDVLKSYAADVKEHPGNFTLPILYKMMSKELEKEYSGLNAGQLVDVVFETLFSDALGNLEEGEVKKRHDIKNLSNGVNNVLSLSSDNESLTA